MIDVKVGDEVAKHVINIHEFVETQALRQAFMSRFPKLEHG